jgi:hypothetical protein
VSYDLKYQSDFYNFFGKLISVKLYKEGYGEHDPILIRTTEVSVDVNYQDDNTPLIGTGAKVVIVNEGTFDSLEDLLTTTEKQFKCTIEYNEPGDSGIPAPAPSGYSFSFSTPPVDITDHYYIRIFEASATERSEVTSRFNLSLDGHTANAWLNVTFNCNPLTFGTKFIIFASTSGDIDRFNLYKEVSGDSYLFSNIYTDWVSEGSSYNIYYNEVMALPVHMNGVVIPASNIVFQGFSICDLNEQEFLPLARISLQFTDYLRRLDSAFLDCLADIGVSTNIISILQEAIQIVGLDYPLYVNSTLFETSMDYTADDTFLELTLVENNMFYSDLTTYDNIYDTLNRALKSFGIYLYSLGNKWILERLDDITRTGSWVVYENIMDSGEPSGASTTSLKQEYNKQDGDFQYIDCSQVIEYDSGLRTLILDLKDKQLETFVFNNYQEDMLPLPPSALDYWPSPGTLDLRKWYIYSLCTAVKSGYSFRGMTTYFEWQTPVVSDDSNEFMGLYYPFQVKFNVSTETPTVLSVNFKMSGGADVTDIDTATLRFALMIDGGPYSGYYILSSGVLSGLYDHATAYSSDFDVSQDKDTRVWSVSVSIDFTSPSVAVPIVFPLPSPLPSLWDALGNPETQKFVICFLPIRYNPDPGSNFSEVDNYIGDIQVNITQEEILNKLTYFINENFIKTETVDIDFFDLPNTNFGNGLLTISDDSSAANELVKTELWETYQYTTHVPLMDIFARVKFGNFCRTLHRLKGTILHDGHLKPFSVLTDDNLSVGTLDSSGSNIIKFLLHGYTWDLVKGTYEIEAVEYTEEDILIDESGGGGDGGGTGTGAVPTFPVDFSLMVTQPVSGDDMYVYWSAMSTLIGAVTYTLQRRPYAYNPAYWNNSWITIYTGTNREFYDAIQESPATIISGTTVEYRLLGTNVNGPSLYCPVESGTWLGGA